MPDRRSLFAVAALAALFLFTFVSVRLPLDQDLGSKAAKIESLSRLAPLASPVRRRITIANHIFLFIINCRRCFISGYRAVRLLVRVTLQRCAALCICWGWRSIFTWLTGVNPWWALFLFLNTPALVVNFLYGNEASLSMALLAVAAGLISLRRGTRFDEAAAVLLGLAFWCRPDIVLMAPFFALLLGEWRRVWRVGAVAAATIVLYWLMFVRAIPSEAGFPWIIDWRIFAVYLVFGFGPVVFVLAVGGFFRVPAKRWLLPLSTIVPLFYYFRDLGSPKYILGLAFGTTLAAAWVIASAGRTFKTLIVAAALLFWFVSITPFGVFGPSRGGHWVAPAGHGPVVFGSYLSFYQHIRDGFFGVRYGALERTWELVLRSHSIDPRPMRLIGSSDDHMLNLICEEHGIGRTSIPLTIDLTGELIDLPGAVCDVIQWLLAAFVSYSATCGSTGAGVVGGWVGFADCRR